MADQTTLTPTADPAELAGGPGTRLAADLAAAMIDAGYSPFFGTPCGVLAPLYSELSRRAGLITVPREDNAVGLAAGAELAGARPVVLMQNSGLGQSVNALASLVVPYGIRVLFVVSLRGQHPDMTPENAAMGRLTQPVLDVLGLESRTLEPSIPARAQISELAELTTAKHCSAVLTVAPDAFGWAA